MQRRWKRAIWNTSTFLGIIGIAMGLIMGVILADVWLASQTTEWVAIVAGVVEFWIVVVCLNYLTGGDG